MPGPRKCLIVIGLGMEGHKPVLALKEASKLDYKETIKVDTIVEKEKQNILAILSMLLCRHPHCPESSTEGKCIKKFS